MEPTEVVIGIDVGGTFTKIGIVDKAGNCLAETSVPTESHKKPEDFLARIHANTIALHEQIGTDKYRIMGVGMGAPNGNMHKGTIEFAPNLGWVGIVPLGPMMTERFGMPAVLTNDANAAALGEMRYGAAKNMSDFVMITLGTGLGSGIVANGKLIVGHDGFAGEIGHSVINGRNRMCGCGRRGCLESYASVTGIKRTVFKFLADMTEPSELRDVTYNQLTGEMVAKAALKNDPIAVEAFKYTGMLLGQQLANTVAHLSPEAIVMFGGLTKAGKYLFDPVREHLEASLLTIYKNKIKVLPSGLEGKNAAVLGAAVLAWEKVESMEKNTAA